MDKVYNTAQTNGEAWLAIDRSMITAKNVVFRLGYPTYSLLDYADPLTEPDAPSDGDSYLVDADGTCWGLAVLDKQILTFLSGVWTILPETLETIFERVQNALAGKGTGLDSTTRITGNGGTDYPAPDSLDINGAIFALNPYDFEVNALMIGPVKTIRFAIPVEDGESPLIVYSKVYLVGSSAGLNASTRITGNGGTDYAAPDDLTVGGEIYALNPYEVEVTSVMAGSVKTIRFTVAVETGEYPLVIYTKP